MPSFVYQVLSLTAIIILSLAQANGLDLTTSNNINVAQSLFDPVANLDGSNVPALEYGTTSNADVSGINLDTHSVAIAQGAVARPDTHGCSKGKRRRRRDETSCPSTDIEVPPSSQQNSPQNSVEQPSNGDTGLKEQQDTPESMPAYAPVSESSCPDEHFPICAAPNLLENPSAPGTFDTIPWVGYNIPQTIDISEYSRFWFPWDPCRTINGEELFLCCKQVKVRQSGLWLATPTQVQFIMRYPLTAMLCTTQGVTIPLP